MGRAGFDDTNEPDAREQLRELVEARERGDLTREQFRSSASASLGVLKAMADEGLGVSKDEYREWAHRVESLSSDEEATDA